MTFFTVKMVECPLTLSIHVVYIYICSTLLLLFFLFFISLEVEEQINEQIIEAGGHIEVQSTYL